MGICYHNLCIYWKDNHCILDTIQIDALGMCTECIPITFDESYLKVKRKELLAVYDNLDQKDK